MPIGYISVGSNIEPEKNVRSSVIALKKQFRLLIISSVYESEAIGFSGDIFYNLVVSFESMLAVKIIAQQLRDIERVHGRTRESQKFSPRSLDLDLLLYGDLILTEDGLQIPRHEIEQYAFVLEPLAEIAPHLLHPIKHQCYADLWQTFDKTHLKQHRLGWQVSA